MASPGGGGAGGGNRRRQQQQQQQQIPQQPSFEAPSPPRVPAAVAQAAQHHHQQHSHEDSNNPLATLAAQLPVLAADPYYGALIGTLPAPVRARLEREGGHTAGAATAGADVVAAAREHYYQQMSTQAAVAAAEVDVTGGASRRGKRGLGIQIAPSQQQQQLQTPKGVVYINPKQYHRILVRRAARAREAAKGVGVPKVRNAFMHASRHEAALRRPRVGGKFLPKGAATTSAGGGGNGGGGRGGNTTGGGTAQGGS